MRFVSRPLSLLFLSLAGGCGQATISIPDTADGTVEAVIGGMVDQNPRVLWAALPGSYRSDIAGLIQTFGETVDEEVYDESFKVVRKIVRVLQDKKGFILNHPMASGMLEKDKVSENWDSFVGFFETLAKSEFSSVSSLQRLDVDRCLGGTGTELMKQLSAMSRMSPADPFGSMREAKVELIESKGTLAKVRVSAPDKPAEEISLVKVDGRWVPSEMAAGWSKAMEKARAALSRMGQDKNSTASAKMVLGMANAFLDQLESTETQEEFNAALQTLFGGFAAPK